MQFCKLCVGGGAIYRRRLQLPQLVRRLFRPLTTARLAPAGHADRAQAALPGRGCRHALGRGSQQLQLGRQAFARVVAGGQTHAPNRLLLLGPSIQLLLVVVGRALPQAKVRHVGGLVQGLLVLLQQHVHLLLLLCVLCVLLQQRQGSLHSRVLPLPLPLLLPDRGQQGERQLLLLACWGGDRGHLP
jgi:hypothetical protein